MQKSQSIVQYMRHGPPARDGIPPLHSDGKALILLLLFLLVRDIEILLVSLRESDLTCWINFPFAGERSSSFTGCLIFLSTFSVDCLF